MQYLIWSFSARISGDVYKFFYTLRIMLAHITSLTIVISLDNISSSESWSIISSKSTSISSNTSSLIFMNCSGSTFLIYSTTLAMFYALCSNVHTMVSTYFSHYTYCNRFGNLTRHQVRCRALMTHYVFICGFFVPLSISISRATVQRITEFFLEKISLSISLNTSQCVINLTVLFR